MTRDRGIAGLTCFCLDSVFSARFLFLDFSFEVACGTGDKAEAVVGAEFVALALGGGTIVMRDDDMTGGFETEGMLGVLEAEGVLEAVYGGRG